MVTYIASFAALAVTSTLLATGISHASSPSTLGTALRKQGLLPLRALRPVVVLVIAAEGVLGVAGTYLVVFSSARSTTALTVALVVSGTMLSTYTAYSWYLMRVRPGSPCGCMAGNYAVNGWVVLRAAALATASFAAAQLSDRIQGLADGIPFAMIATSGLATATILWHLPAALRVPQLSLAAGNDRGSLP